MTINAAFLCIFLLWIVSSVYSHSFRNANFHPADKLIGGKSFKERTFRTSTPSFNASVVALPVYIGPQDGLKESDKIESLPGQPDGVDFDQYSGYVTVDPNKGRALFYYFTESPQNSSTNPLVLWLNGGPGCSSLGAGAMMELGPFRVNSDNVTLDRNKYAWNNEANFLFLESPAGVGFSYSNTTSDYDLIDDDKAAQDSYTFLVNWLERFPEYKTRDFYITGESYAGHYVPQLAQTVLYKNKYSNQTIINLKGIAIGNALIDQETTDTGTDDFLWTHALVSDANYWGPKLNCTSASKSNLCKEYIKYNRKTHIGHIDFYNIYAPFCGSSKNSAWPISSFDPCTVNYIDTYLNIPEVQKALHANVTSLPYRWEECSDQISYNFGPDCILQVIRELMESGLRLWIYSGDTDAVVPITATRYALAKMDLPVETPWYPWYMNFDEVGGYAAEYTNLTFVSIRGAGHFVPSYQPARALVMISSFLKGKLPPSLQDL